MADSTHGQKPRYAVGVFHRVASLRRGLQDLIDAAVEASALCLAGQQQLMENAGSHETAGEGGDLLAGLTRDSVVVSGDGEGFPLRVSSSSLAEQLAGGDHEGKARDSRWLERWLIPRHARALESHLAAGRYLLWVRIRDADDEKRICTILLEHSDFPIQVHDLAL